MLIDKTEIAKHREISKNVRDEKINPYIEDAELQDLQPLLGESLYNDIVNNPTNHTDLLDGGEYTYNGETYKQPGLKKVLAIFANSRYVMFGSYTDTGFGLVQKSNQDSTPVTESGKRNIYTEDRKSANLHFNSVAAFLGRTAYPLWKTGTQRTSGFRISKIS